MKKAWIVVPILMLVLLGSFQPVAASQGYIYPYPSNSIFRAGQNAPDCYSLDIVFLIDQSLSMSRVSHPNDPLGQRFNAPRYALDWLANNRLSRLGLCPDAVHRIGVISFGSDVIVDLPLTRIEPSSQLEWDNALPGLEDQIEERSMGGTNPMKAFQYAKEMLDGAEPLGVLPRKRALVLLTDGQPCITEGCTDPDDFYPTYIKDLVNQVNEDFPFSTSLEARDRAIQEAEQKYGSMDKIPEAERNRILVDYPVTNDELYNSIYLWIIAMNDAYPYLDSVGEAFGTMSDKHNGDLIDLDQNLLEIPKVFNQIMSDLADLKPTLLGCGNLAVDPYLSGVVLDIYKAANGLEVEIEYNGKNLKNGSGDKDYFGLAQYSIYGAVEHYRFKNPPAGLWKIVCSDPNGAQVSYMPFNPQIQMIEPTGVLPQYDLNNAIYDPLHRFYLRYKIVNQTDAEPLNADLTYPLDMKATISNPNGTQTILPFDFESDGIWVSRDPLPVNVKGLYQIDLLGSAPCVVDPDKPEHCPSPNIEVIHSTTGQYEVGEISLFLIKVVDPVDGSEIPLHGNLFPNWLAEQAIMVEVQLMDLDGQSINPSEVLSGNREQALTAVLKVGAQQFTSAFAPDPTDGSRFTAKFDIPAMPGLHVLEITMGDVYNFEDYRPQKNPVIVQFIRHDPLLNNPLFYRILLALLVTVISGSIVYVIWLRTFPLLGALEFVKHDEQGEHRASLNLAHHKRQIVFAGSKIPGDLKTDFKRIEAQNQPGQGRSSNKKLKVRLILDKSPFNMVDGQSLMKNGWQVSYNWGQPSRQRDLFFLWTVVVIIISIVVIVGIVVI